MFILFYKDFFLCRALLKVFYQIYYSKLLLFYLGPRHVGS